MCQESGEKEEYFMTSTYKQLSFDERLIIQNLLSNPNITLKMIALTLNRSPKAIRYEMTHHLRIVVRANTHNKCGRQNQCDHTRLCTHCLQGHCKFCKHDNCNDLCPDFISTPICKHTSRFPYVCNNCPDAKTCKLPKVFYTADVAQKQRDDNVSSWKEGPKKSEAQMKTIVDAFEKGVKQSLSPDIIIHNNQLDISVSTAYRYIHFRHMGAIINLDLKRQVKYKTRSSSKHVVIPINYDWLEGRRYEDYIERIENEDVSINIWQMDAILGKQGNDEKCVLSLLHTRSNLQLYYLLKEKSMLAVQRAFEIIKDVLGPELFSMTFPIILTDNGSEFHDPLSLETDASTGEKLISIYYCKARRSDQKGKCEKNHEHFRECVPKGKSMNALTQKDINYVSNMVNNYPRRSLNYNSPIDIATLSLNEKVLSLNKLKHLNIKQVKLTPITH